MALINAMSTVRQRSLNTFQIAIYFLYKIGQDFLDIGNTDTGTFFTENCKLESNSKQFEHI